MSARLASAALAMSAVVQFDGIRLETFERDGGIAATPSDAAEGSRALSVAQLKFGAFGAQYEKQTSEQGDSLENIKVFLASVTVEDTRPGTGISPKYRHSLAIGTSDDEIALEAKIIQVSEKASGDSFVDVDAAFAGLHLIVSSHIMALKAFATETTGMLPETEDAQEETTEATNDQQVGIT